MDMRVSVADIRREVERFPERSTCRGSIDRHQACGVPSAFKQRRSQLAADAASPISPTNIKTPHTQSVGHDGLDREPADPGEDISHTRSEQGFSLAIEAYCARHPISRKPLDEPIPLGARFRLQGIEPRGQLLDHP